MIRIRKKTILIFQSLVLCVALLGVIPTVGQASTAILFTDVVGHWAEKAINQAVEKGFVEGYPDGTFKPDAKVSRAEFIKMVITGLGIVQGPTNAGGHWYDNYVNAATASHFYKNEFEGNFNSAITRQEMALISVRATNEEIRNQTDFNPRNIMYEATKVGLIKGLDDKGTLGENQTTTRAQSITIIERITQINKGETLSVDQNAVKNAEEIKNVSLDQWGKVIRKTNLPKNAADFPYILEGVPNEMYEMQFYTINRPDALTTKQSFLKMKNFTKENIDIWSGRAKAYYEMLFNVDYLTIGDSKVWADKLFSYMNHGVNVENTMKKITKYADWVKENKIQIEGFYEPEPSMTYFNGSDFVIRAKARITIKNYVVNKKVIYDSSYDDDVKLRKKTYDTFLDTTMGTNMFGDGDYSNTIAVSGPTIYGYSSLRYVVEKENSK